MAQFVVGVIAPRACLAAVVFASLGCESGPNAAAPVTFAQRDSTGVTISMTPGADARAPLGWIVDPEPDLVIGEGDSPTEYLTRVEGVRGLPGGEVLVVDGGTAELRFYGADGSLRHRAGGKGEGPGEFGDPVLVRTVGEDSLLLFDREIPRYQIFSLEGEASRTIPFRTGWPHGRAPPEGVYRSLSLFQGFDGLVEALAELGLLRVTWVYLWFDHMTLETAELTSYEVDLLFGSSTGVRALPFLARPSATVSPRGALITDGMHPEIREFDFEGRLLRIFRIHEAGRPVTQSMIERQIDLEVAATPRLSRARKAEEYAELPVPDTLPVFSSLQFDAEGRLWAERYGWDPELPTEWVVFDPDGRARGTVQTPPGLRVEYIGDDYLLGVRTDEFDVEYVHRHGLQRR